MFPAACAAVICAAAAVSAAVDTAKVPFVVNTNATVKAVKGAVTVQKSVTANAQTIVAVPISAVGDPAGGGGEGTGVLNGAQRQLSGSAVVSSRDGAVALRLSPQSYKNAEISLYAVSGKRVLRSHATATDAAKKVSRRNLTAGVYLLSVIGTDGNYFASRVTHGGGSLEINVAFLNETVSSNRNLAKEAADAGWAITVSASASGYVDSAYTLSLDVGTNPTQTITLRQATIASTPKADFKETVGSVSFDMVYIPGGKFKLGCESGTCVSPAKPVDAEVSNYFIMKTEVTTALWNAVMGKSGGSTSSSYASATWYDAFEFACELGKKTGRNYRIMTEAEFEYAAKKYKDKLLKIGDGSSINGEEWAYNSWDVDKHEGGLDPLGPTPGAHTQKTRRDANGTGESNITSRLIRSIDGTGPSIRLVFSADVAYPPKYTPSCEVHAPVAGAEPANSYRDPRWVTGNDKQWGAGAIAIGSISLSVWEDGTAKLGSANGQWFTSNNFTFVFVPSSGSITKYAYIFLDSTQGSLISEKGFMNGGYIGRIQKKAATVAKPTVSGLKSGEELAKAQTKFADEFAMIDMENIPAAAKKQDPRLLDGGDTKGWFQDNTSMSAAHHYRKDIDLDAFRFTVNQGNGRTPLAAGTWFTVNNTFLRVTHKNGYVAEYLYTIADDGTFYHNSFIGYERGDFRMFKKETNGSSWPQTSCGNICSQEIPKDITPVAQTGYQSTYTPAKCPSGGCK